MATENVELARRGYEAFKRGDVEAVLEFIDPQIEVHDSPELPDRRVWHGYEGFVGNLSNMFDIVQGFELEPDEFIDAGEKLLVAVRVRGHGRSSGIAMEDHLLHVWTIRDRKGTRLEVYRDREQAREAAGLD
jgi:ketosteroid isomerase-like protein